MKLLKGDNLFFFYELWKETSTRVEYVHVENFCSTGAYNLLLLGHHPRCLHLHLVLLPLFHWWYVAVEGCKSKAAVPESLDLDPTPHPVS